MSPLPVCPPHPILSWLCDDAMFEVNLTPTSELRTYGPDTPLQVKLNKGIKSAKRSKHENAGTFLLVLLIVSQDSRPSSTLLHRIPSMKASAGFPLGLSARLRTHVWLIEIETSCSVVRVLSLVQARRHPTFGTLINTRQLDLPMYFYAP